MRKSNNLIHTLIWFLMTGILSCSPDEPITPLDSSDPLQIHPRIILFKGEEEIIRQSIETSATWKKMHEAIIAASNNIITRPVLERDMIGRRLLGTSREALRRIFYLSYSYRMTGNSEYFLHAEKEMMAVAGFGDWNPSHFLDVGEMTMALAIGYDWLYDRLPPKSRKIIRDAILRKGLEPSFNTRYNWFLRSTTNWNQVCNAGMTFGALAVYEHYPEISKEVIDRAFNTITLPKEDYRPDGAYPEGYGYWNYGTTFNVMFLSAVEKIWPGRFDYNQHLAFLETGSFLKNMLAPSGSCYNWGDNGSSGRLSPAMFWFAEKNNQPSLLWKEKSFLGSDNYLRFTGDRLLPAILIWGKDIVIGEITEPDKKMYVAQGQMPLTIMRTSWSDPDAVFLGFKGGSPSVNHGHMDIGSFVLEADGVRWASDLGMQNYESLESKGLNIWNMSQDSDRWTVYRLNNYSHNTLTVNEELQLVDGYAKIDRYSDNPDFSFAVSDISAVYNTQLESLTRGAGIVNQEYVVIRDELESNSDQANVCWQMLTEAEVTITGSNTAILTRDGKQLFFRVDEPANIQVTTRSTDPGTEWDVANPGTILVGFEVVVPGNESSTLDVKLIPASADTDAVFDKSLAEW